MSRYKRLLRSTDRRAIRALGAPALGACGATALAAALDASPIVLALAAAAGSTAGARLGYLAARGRMFGSGEMFGTGDASAPTAQAAAPAQTAPSAEAAAAPKAKPNQRPGAGAEPDPPRPSRAASDQAMMARIGTEIEKSVPGALDQLDIKAALGALPASLLMLDRSGRVLFANARAVEEIGRSPEGLELPLLLRAPSLIDALAAAYQSGQRQETTFSLRGARERTLQAVFQPVEDAGAGVRMMALLQDQTRIRRAEQLHRDFVANASHELKTPLAAIAGFIETLRGPARDDPAAHERFLSIMAQQTERMRLLIVDLMSLNRIELNEHVAPQEEIALDDVIDDAVSHVSDAAAASRAVLGEPASTARPRIEIRRSEMQLSILGDHSELVQALANLIDNALKYGGESPPVVIVDTAGAPAGRVNLTVEDSGPGIAKDHIPRLTERFYRVGGETSPTKSGTGLGLAIVKHVVARHRGELSIHSRLGHGSRFTLSLPIHSAANRDQEDDDAEQGENFAKLRSDSQ